MEWISGSYGLDRVQCNFAGGMATSNTAEVLSVADVLDASDLSLQHLIEGCATAVFCFAVGGPNRPSNRLNFLSIDLSICGCNRAADDIGIFCERNDETRTRLHFVAHGLVGTAAALVQHEYRWFDTIRNWAGDNTGMILGVRFQVGVTVPSQLGLLTTMTKLQLAKIVGRRQSTKPAVKLERPSNPTA